MISEDSVDDREDLGLVTLHDLAKSDLIVGLNAANQGRCFSMAMIHSGFGPGLLARCGKGKNCAQAIHTNDQTYPIDGRLQASYRGSLASVTWASGPAPGNETPFAPPWHYLPRLDADRRAASAGN